jgi:hypothetical protein
LPTVADVLASIRGATDQDTQGPITDTLLVLWLNEEYATVRRRIAGFAPSLFTAVSPDLVVTSPATSIDISSLTTLLQILEVQQKQGVTYFSLRPSGPNAEFGALSWRQRGFPGAGCAVDISPMRQAPGTYRVRYVVAPTPFVIGTLTAPVLLPAGGERVLIEAVAARVRVREEEDPSAHLAARDAAFDDLRRNLTPRGAVIADVTGRY